MREGLRWGRAGSWLLLPLLLAQALYVRCRIPRLPEAAGARTGTCGQGQSLRLLITGDSAAAGVGVAHQSQALAGQLSERLAANFEISWSLQALSGRTTAATISCLRQAPVQVFDVAIISLGVNDLLAGLSAQRWIAELAQLSVLLAERFQVRQVLWSPLPPMHLFPALPQPLRAYLGARAQHFNGALARYVASAGRCALVQVDLTSLSTADDGFHPGAEAYAAWADALAQHIRSDAHWSGPTSIQHDIIHLSREA